MIVSRVILKNWKNFRNVDVELGERMFIVGPNASGKSNFLDVFRFLSDLAKDGGGLQKAIKERGGVSKVRCLAARQDPDIEIEVHLSDGVSKKPIWRYALGIKQELAGSRRLHLKYEKVWQREKQIVTRPDVGDEKDFERLMQTHLEQINANSEFREISKFFSSFSYLHIVPQLLRYSNFFSGPGVPGDPFGMNFLEKVSKTSKNVRNSRLKKIERALKVTVPQLKEFKQVSDERGIPHLEAIYEHWRPKGAKQREDQFSDGTLRLIGLLWSLLDGDSVLLLEEPELSLNSGIVRKLPALIYRLQRVKKRQVIISTHSADLLAEEGIGGDSVLLLSPTNDGTIISTASSDKDINNLLVSGLNIADAVLPYTVPSKIDQLNLFE